MKVITIQSNSVEELNTKVDSIVNSNFNHNLAIVFASVSHNLQKVSEIFDKHNIKIFGSGTGAEIMNDEVLEHSIVVMLFDIKEEYFTLYYQETQNNNTAQISENAAKYAKKKFENPAFIVLTSSLATDGVSVIEGISEVIKSRNQIFGGMASDIKMEKTTIFTNKKIIDEGVIFLILDNNKIEVKGIATSGWEAVGSEKIITKAKRNTIYTIDDKPALDMFLKYYGLENSTEPIGLSIGAKYPLQVNYENKTPVLRTPVSGNSEDGSITLTGRIEQGAKVKFTTQATFEIIDKTIAEIKEFKTEVPETDAMIMFSCKGRKVAFGPMMEDEIEGIHEIWNAPLIGFFTYGEIGNAKNQKSDFHNETCSLVLLKEV